MSIICWTWLNYFSLKEKYLWGVKCILSLIISPDIFCVPLKISTYDCFRLGGTWNQFPVVQCLIAGSMQLLCHPPHPEDSGEDVMLFHPRPSCIWIFPFTRVPQRAAGPSLSKWTEIPLQAICTTCGSTDVPQSALIQMVHITSLYGGWYSDALTLSEKQMESNSSLPAAFQHCCRMLTQQSQGWS